jgi:hypothetical protein
MIVPSLVVLEGLIVIASILKLSEPFLMLKLLWKLLLSN